MDAVILAGGMGERLQAVISDVPKPMAPVGGRPFLERVMNYWLREKINRFILCVGFKHNLIEKHFGSGQSMLHIVNLFPAKVRGKTCRFFF